MIAVFQHAPLWPFERVRWLRNVSSVSYSFELMDVGKFQFYVPVNDTAVRIGDLIGIVSTEGMPDFAGWVEAIDDAEDGPYATVTGSEFAVTLAQRNTRRGVRYTGGVATAMAEIIQYAASRNPLGFTIRRSSSSGPLPADYEPQSTSVLDALNELAAQTGWEWAMRYRVGTAIEADFVVQETIGDDLRDRYQASRPVRADYKRDIIREQQLVEYVAGAGAFGSRPGAGALVDAPLGLQDTTAIVIPVTPEASRRRQRRSFATARETAIVDVGVSDAAAAQRKAIETLRMLNAGRESLAVTFATNVDWTRLRLGNVITVLLGRVNFEAGLRLPFRILGMQPDEEHGTVELVGRVLPDAA